MKATDFELRHQTLLHLMVVGFAFLTYGLIREDIVWLIVRDSSHAHFYERALFGVAALLVGAGAVICTWARAYCDGDLADASASVSGGLYRYFHHPMHAGRMLYAIGLGSLAPVPGFVILVAGEAILVFRLIRRTGMYKDQERPATPSAHNLLPNWKKAVRQESIKWGVFVTMIVFTIVLIDRVADYLVLASFVVWLVLNPPRLVR